MNENQSMSEQRVSLYEGMFLFPQSASADFEGVIDHVNEILNRADAEIVAMRKWDERRLAYDIKGNKRGLYILVYFRAEHSRLAGIERDCNLSELLLRSLVIKAEHIPTEEIEANDQREGIKDEIALRKADAEKAADAEVAAAAAAAAPAAPVAVAEEPAAAEPADAEPAPEATEDAAGE